MKRRRFSWIGIPVGLGVCLAMLGGASGASALTITVSTTNDELGGNPAGCSLREAISSANSNSAIGGCTAGSGADVIKLPGGEYRIVRPGSGEDLNSTGDFDITGSESVTVEPSGGDDKVTVDGNGLDRVFDQLGTAALQVNNLTVTGGQTPVLDDGGGIRNGGAGTLTLNGATVTDNQATVSGGGVVVYASSTIVNSTISDNRSGGGGGGIYAAGSTTLTVRSSTITDNEADYDANDTGDGGGFNEAMATSVSFFNVINAENRDGSSLPANQWPDCYSTSAFFFPRFTLSTQAMGAGNCLVGFAHPGNQVVADPMIGPLADNGGQTRTHALLEGSPAIGAGGTTGTDTCPPVDQNGNPRPADSCDIGAVQFIGNDTPIPPPGGGAADMKIVKVKPKKLKLKRGKKAKKAKVVVRNDGDAAGASVEVCLKLPKKTRKAIKLKGKKCRNTASFAPGKKVYKFKLKAKKKAGKKAYKGKVTMNAEGAGTKKAKLKIKVK